jgi:hypothetical protein
MVHSNRGCETLTIVDVGGAESDDDTKAKPKKKPRAEDSGDGKKPNKKPQADDSDDDDSGDRPKKKPKKLDE